MAASKKEMIIVGCDHAGFKLKEAMIQELTDRGFAVKDVGAHSDSEPSDYPIYASRVAGAVSAGAYKRGILVDGEGMGSLIVANRYPRVHATLCLNQSMARIARGKNDSNLLVLAQRYTPEIHAAEILDTWLKTRFAGGRHKRRINLINDSSHLNLAFRHLDEVNLKNIENSAINRGFMKRALTGLDQVKKMLLPPERRGDHDERAAESLPTNFTYDGTKYKATVLDLSEGGAQLALSDTTNFPYFTRGEKLGLEIKTSYGAGTVDAEVRWIDQKSNLFGVSFMNLPKNKKHPLRLAMDSVF